MTQLKEESGLLPGEITRLVCAIPRALCSDEAAANVLHVATLLRSHRVPDFALSAAVNQCPDIFTVQVFSPSLDSLLMLPRLKLPCNFLGFSFEDCSTSILTTLVCDFVLLCRRPCLLWSCRWFLEDKGVKVMLKTQLHNAG